jgi:hypothetical protein
MVADRFRRVTIAIPPPVSRNVAERVTIRSPSHVIYGRDLLEHTWIGGMTQESTSQNERLRCWRVVGFHPSV